MPLLARRVVAGNPDAMPHSHVAVLISDPAAPALSDALIASARAALPGAGEPRILDAGIAAEIPCAAGADIDALRAALAPAPLDVAILPAEGRRKSCSSPIWTPP